MILHDVPQRSAEWFALRAGKPTASEFSRVVTSAGEPSKSAYGYALTLAAEMFVGQSIDAWEGNAWTERGRELEIAARSAYEFVCDVSVTPVGIVTDDAGATGCSPDGFAGDDGLIEIKCLKAENHIKTILYYRKHGRSPPDYMQQTQGQMWICERKWCDLIFFHPVLPLLIIRETPNLAILTALAASIPPVCKDRDEVLRALREQANPDGHTPSKPIAFPTPSVNLQTAKPIF